MNRRASLLAFLVLASGLAPVPQALGQNLIELSELKLRLGDGILVIFLPPVSSVSSTVNALGNMTYFYAVFTNEQASFVQSLGGIEASIVEMIPKAPGRYGISINFTALNVTRLFYGMITNNASFYSQGLGTYSFGRDTVFVLMRPIVSISPGSGTVVMSVTVSAPPRDSTSIFNIILPPISKMAFVALLVGLLAYWNSYVVLDTYFLSKSEHISNWRKALVALSLGISALLVYLYVFE